MAASSTGIRVGAWSKRSARAGDKQVAREGNDDGLAMGAKLSLPRSRFCLVTQRSSSRVTRQKRLQGRLGRAFIIGHYRVPPSLCKRNEVKYSKYEELWRSRRVLSPRQITPSEISIILHMIRKPNSITVLLFSQNNS